MVFFPLTISSKKRLTFSVTTYEIKKREHFFYVIYVHIFPRVRSLSVVADDVLDSTMDTTMKYRVFHTFFKNSKCMDYFVLAAINTSL